MKNLIDEIRQQPEHIRHIFMWTMVVITFSVVGFVWFRQTTKQFVALLHPQEAQERALAQQEIRNERQRARSKSFSPFATIFDSVRDLRANILELMAGPKNLNINNDAVPTEKQLPPQKLPISN